MAEQQEPGASVTSLEPAPDRSLVDRMIAPYFAEPSLWPVLLVLLAHGVLGVGVALLDAIRDGMGFGAISLGFIAVGTLFALAGDLRRRHIGFTSISLLCSWAFGALTAWAADHYGLY